MKILQADLTAVEGLYKRGLYLQAYNLSRRIAPLLEWEGSDAKLLAASLIHNLGSPQLSVDWTRNVWRKDRRHPKATIHYAFDRLHSKGAVPALLFIRSAKPQVEDVGLNVWLHCLYAGIYASLNDFEQAETWLDAAFALDYNDSWAWVTKAHILEQQDLYKESLAAAQQALKVGGWRRSSVLSAAHILALMERYDEAGNLLTEASKHLESAWIVKELADLQSELGDSVGALANYEKLLYLMPLREKEIDKWLYSRLSDMAYLARDVRKAVHYAEIADTPHLTKFKEQLISSNGTKRRVQLKVGFVRQHKMTCAPATISNISRYWKKEIEHLKLADEICYDGTAGYNERDWAEKNGWKVREFTVNWENAVELINRRIPFTLATIQPGNGHLQAVIGYDEIKKTFLIRDPYYRKVSEFLVDELLENQVATGPRGMVLIPNEYAHLLNGLELKESRQYDFHYHIELSLKNHNRQHAVQLLEKMQEEFPDHRLTLRARWALAYYDCNDLSMLDAVEGLRKMFPDDINLKMSYLSVAQEHLRHDEKRALLEEYSKAKITDPLIWQMLGADLGADARQHKRAMRWIYKSLRCLPSHSLNYRLIADIYWAKRDFAQALELYRAAACLNDKDESLAWSYFQAARHLEQTEKALQYLKDRFERFGHLSRFPALTLFHALRELGLTVEAFEILQRAIEKRPDDGELKIFVAESKARFGLMEEAKSYLLQSASIAPRRDFLRTSASIAELEGELTTALQHWKEILQLEPLAMDAHQSTAFFLAATESRAAAQNYLKEVSSRFPHHRVLRKYLLEWMSDEEPKTVIPIVQNLIELDTRDDWSHREMARWLIKQKRFDLALKEAETALELDPNEPLSHYLYGYILKEMNRFRESYDSFIKALRLSVDFSPALEQLMELSRSRDEKLNALAFVKNQLTVQVSFGNAILNYYETAKRFIESETLLNELKAILEKRLDLWSAWSVVICQLVDMKRLDEALSLAEKATRRFPLNQGLWYDLSFVYKVKGETENEIKALQKGLSINANWSFGIQQLSEAFCRKNQTEEARKLLEDGVRRMPLDAYLHGYLADIYWKLENKDSAIETVKKALTLDNEYDWGWVALKTWLRSMKRSDELEKMAWQLASAKPRDVNSWLTLARILDEPHQFERQFEAIGQALKLDGNNVRATILKAKNLANRKLYDKALRVCDLVLPNGRRPEELIFLSANIESMRGNVPQAVVILEKLTQTSPEYYPAWESLADFYRESESHKEKYFQITREMTRIAPQDSVVFGYHGEAALFVENYEEAKKAFKQAIALDPNYEFGACVLFDLCFDDGNQQECLLALKHLKEFIKTGGSAMRQIKFYAREKNKQEAKKLWKQLCLSADANRRQFDRAIVTLRENGIFPPEYDFLKYTLLEYMNRPEASPLLGEIWMENFYKNYGFAAAEKSFGEFKKDTEVWRKAVDHFFELLYQDKEFKKMRNVIENRAADLKQDNETWALCGYYLNTIKEHQKAAEWFADWSKRENLKPWMLWNYTLSLNNLGRTADAQRIHLEALKIEEDGSVNLHRTMIGLEKAATGKFTEAKHLVGKIDTENFRSWEQFFYFLLTSLLDISESAKRSATERDRSINKMISGSLSHERLWKDKVMRSYFNKSLEGVFAQNISGAKKAWIKLKIWSSYIFSLMNKPIGSK
ncbi:MAG: C39 family peptidase [Pyrinomonadaceae bacterium]|nr:C39 family peptidase [Pyrinomonadaceae bacterium]